MSAISFEPTDEQVSVFNHDGSAFISACPGAGKTRVLTERARRLFQGIASGRGVAFLSFTQAAVCELEARLRDEQLLPSPVFPSFVGTFDSFVWQFLVAPFGAKGSSARPRLIPDVGQMVVKPFTSAHPLTLSCFCPVTGAIFEQAAKRKGFDPSGKPDSQIQQYRTAAMRLRLRLNECGHMGFDEVRAAAIDRIKTPLVSKRIAAALAARFVEVVVDEAQDCNEEDLELITWLRDSGMSVKVVCDPHQSIYQFRGGVTNHLFAFEETFPPEQRKRLTGNFRSTSNICKAIAQFRPPSVRGFADESRGPFRDDATPIRILSYRGQSVPASVGLSFHSLLEDAGIDATFAPIVAATNRSGSAAAGQPRPTDSNHRTIRLAEAVTTFAFAGGVHDLTSAIDRAHEILLELEGHLDDRSYHQYLRESGIDAGIWRPRVISILRALRFDPVQHSDARGWHAAAKLLLSNELTVCGGHSISQKLKWNSALGTALASAPVNSAMPRTIHSVKGAEFPAVCVVTTKTLKAILDFLETGEPDSRAEEARKLYVAASRAERLLVIAAPRSQAERLSTHLSGQGAVITISEI